MTKRAGPTKYARIAILVQMLLLGVVAGELYDRSHVESTPASARPRPVVHASVPADRLQTRVRDLEFNGMPVSEVLWDLAWWSGENLGANWPELEQDLGVLPTDPIFLRMKRPTLASALDEICQRLHRKPSYYATYGQGPGGIVVVGAANSASNGSIPIIASVFDVHDLLGTPAKLQPLPQVPPYEIPRDIEAREDLRDLANALKTLQPEVPIISFGTRLIVSGTPQASRAVKLALDAIRDPVPIRHEENWQAGSGPLRIIMQREIADPLLEYWKKLFGKGVTFRTSGEMSGSPEEPVIVSVSGASFDDLGSNPLHPFEFPILFIAPGEVDEFARIRRVKLEDGPRAYDVSSILADSKRWMASSDSAGGQAAVTIKEKQDALKELIRHYVDDAGSFDPAESTPIVFWKGLLLVRQDPAVHRHLLAFLEHLQRTGRPVDPTPDQ